MTDHHGLNLAEIERKATVTSTRLKELLSYDPVTGWFVRLVSAGGKAAGSRAGTVNSDGHRQIVIDGVSHYEHRLAWFYVTGKWPAGEVDHENRVRDDNRWDNLREATASQQRMNSEVKTISETGVKGVRILSSGRFQAYAWEDRRVFSLGTFGTLEEAARTRRAWEQTAHGVYAA